MNKDGISRVSISLIYIKIFYPSPETWKKNQFELVEIYSLFSKMQFIKLDISNWWMSKLPKIPVQIDRRSGSLLGCRWKKLRPCLSEIPVPCLFYNVIPVSHMWHPYASKLGHSKINHQSGRGILNSLQIFSFFPDISF